MKVPDPLQPDLLSQLVSDEEHFKSMPDCHELKECVSDAQGVSLIIWQVLVIRGNTDEFRFYVGGSLGSAQKTAAQRKRSDERIQTVQALIIFRRCWSWQSSQTLTVPLEHTSARARSIDQLNFFLRLKARRTKKQEVTSARALGVVGALTPGHKPHARSLAHIIDQLLRGFIGNGGGEGS